LIGSRKAGGRFWCLALILIAVGCAKYMEASKLTEYVNQDILRISELETLAFQRYGEVTGKNFTTNQAAIAALKKDVIPIYKRFLDFLRKIDPRNDELRQLHAIFIRGAETVYSGFKTKLVALEKQDDMLIRIADEKIRKGVQETFKWRLELNALYKKYGIVKKTP
jgi:hypothetical protein